MTLKLKFIYFAFRDVVIVFLGDVALVGAVQGEDVVEGHVLKLWPLA